MDAIKFVKERNRMCKSFGGSCDGCPADKNTCCDTFEWQEKLVTIVEEWSKENPLKTRQSVFLKQYPNARIDSQNSLYICPADAYGDTVCPRNKKDGNVICYDCRREFWSKEVE